jgi:hypothetical protein
LIFEHIGDVSAYSINDNERPWDNNKKWNNTCFRVSIYIFIRTVIIKLI